MTVRAKIGPALAAVAVDMTGLTGAGLVSYGAWLIYHPAGFIVAGALLLAAAWLVAARVA